MELTTLIDKAIEEDLGEGDITTDTLVDPKLQASATLSSKQTCVLAGLDIAHKVFTRIDSQCKWDPQKQDGEWIEAGETIVKIRGKAASLLKAERVALNFLQHLCGIATQTRKFVDAVRNTKVKILDTRKTLPGWRALEKYAVRMGGGNNHRLGLFDRYLIKNNHIDVAGCISKAVEKVLSHKKSGVLMEVEVRNLEELKTVLKYPVDIILLDNFDAHLAKEAVQIGKGRVKFEASGGINLSNVAEYAATGVDFISIGALTHSAPASDLHLVVHVH